MVTPASAQLPPEQTPLHSKKRSDHLYPEESSNPFDPHADYHDEGRWMTRIKYKDYNPLPDVKEKFDSREEMAEEIVATRIESLPRGDYGCFEAGLFKKLCGAAYRFFFGETAYQLKLLGKSSSLRHPNYSVKPVRDFEVRITPIRQLRENLGMTDPQEDYRIWSKSTWSKNGPNGLVYKNEEGEDVLVHDAVISSKDRSADKIGMMRAVDDHIYTNESIAYTGRPDTKGKAIEQITFMFQRELNKGDAGQGITEKDGVYEFTYVVNNLMSPIECIGLVTFDELASIERERDILQELSQETLTINGHQVRVKPLYFNQMFNQGIYYGELGAGSSQATLNAPGYETLLELARKTTLSGEEQPLLEAALRHLENPSDLLPEEELFYRDLLSKLLRIPIVIHCKSSTDRTIIALAISMTLKQWRNTHQEFPLEHPHLILQSETFKELFAANVMSGHQVTRVSRTAQGKIKDHAFEERVLGFQWEGNPIALRLMPNRYKKTSQSSDHPWFIGTLKSIMSLASIFFSWATDYFSKKLAYLERAYPNEQFDTESPYVKDRSLFKPSGMIV